MDTAVQALQSTSITEGGANAPIADQAQPSPAINLQDAQAFEQALNSAQQVSAKEMQIDGSPAADKSSLADDVLQKMQSLSTNAAEKGEALERLIVKATQTLNPLDIVQANRMMSEYYLENLMTAKLVGNATKAIERLTSLN